MIISILLALAVAQDKPILPIPGWNTDLKSGFAEAKKTGRPLMVVFR